MENRLDHQHIPGKDTQSRVRVPDARAGGEEAPGGGLREGEAPLGAPGPADWTAGRARHGGPRGGLGLQHGHCLHSPAAATDTGAYLSAVGQGLVTSWLLTGKERPFLSKTELVTLG